MLSKLKNVSPIILYPGLALAAIVGLVLILSTFFIIQEGEVGVIKRWGKATHQVDPGFHMKWPIADSVITIDVRQRKNLEELSAATQNQLPVLVTTSLNWTVDKSSAMDLFIKYGGLKQFETRILDPKLRSAAKGAISKFPADSLIGNREKAVHQILITMQKEMEEFPMISVNSPQIENIEFPEDYLTAVKEKEKAREEAEREKHRLAAQELQSRQQVNTAQANADSRRLEADAKAYQIKAEAEAEAEAIRLVNSELENADAYVRLQQIKHWDGKLPVYMFGGDGESSMPSALLNLPAAAK